LVLIESTVSSLLEFVRPLHGLTGNPFPDFLSRTLSEPDRAF